MSEAFKPVVIEGGVGVGEDGREYFTVGEIATGSDSSQSSFPEESAFAPSPPNPLIARLEQLQRECLEIARKKNADYASDADPFANFNAAPVFAGVPVERGMMVRMGDKVVRVRNLLDHPPSVKDESIRDSLLDLSNYCLIMVAYLEKKEAGL